MEVRITKRLELLKRLSRLLIKHIEELQKHPQLLRIGYNLLDYSQEFDLYVRLVNFPDDGYEKKIERARKKLASTVGMILFFALQEMRQIKTTDQIKRFACSEKEIRKFKETKLIAFTKKLLSSCKEKKYLTQKPLLLSVTHEELEDLKQKVSDLRDKKKEDEDAHIHLHELVDKTNWILYNQLYPCADSTFAKKTSSFYTEYKLLVQPLKIKTSQVSVIGQILDKDSKAPITGAKIEILMTNIVKRVYSKRGNFRIKNMMPGTYTLVCTHKTYRLTEIQLIIAWRETRRIVIPMERDVSSPAEKKFQYVSVQ
jgi:hypothetical protein